MTQSRSELLSKGLRRAGIDAVICCSPSNVLLASGYWPVVGKSFVVATADGRCLVYAPRDEERFTRGIRGELQFFREPKLGEITEDRLIWRNAVHDALTRLRLDGAVIGIEEEQGVPSSYAAVHRPLPMLYEALEDWAGRLTVRSAATLISEMRSVLDAHETSKLRDAVAIAGNAFRAVPNLMGAGLTELQAASGVRAMLDSVRERSDGYLFCMSGENSAHAFGAYAYSTSRHIGRSEFILLHCNSYCEGFWTDITRTFVLGPPSESQRNILAALLEARDVALKQIRPGVRAAEIDKAARETLAARGIRDEFKHPAGHGVGFAAIDHNALPRLQPASPDVLEEGMVFNLEPAAYFEGVGGARHCDMVLVTAAGAELLTPFQGTLQDLLLS